MSSGARELIWVKSGPLHPLDTGGKIRTHGMLRALRDDFRVHFLALRPEGTRDAVCTAAAEYSDRQTWIPHPAPAPRGPRLAPALARNLFLSRLPFSIERYRSRAMHDALRAAIAQSPGALVLCDFLTPAVNVLDDWRPPPAVSLLFQHNVESAIWHRLAAAETRPWVRAYLRSQHDRMRRFEQRASAAFDGVITVSPSDSETFRHEFGLSNVLGDVPTGVDTERYTSANRKPEPDRIAFLGSMDWMPNIDAVHHFVKEILPRIRTRRPGARFVVIGRNPPESIRALATTDPAIEVTGTVEDVRPHLDRAALLVVPLRAGGGTRIKLFEAAASGIPAVSTRIGAEGLPLEDGVHLRLADAPEAFADAVVDLLADTDGANRLAAAARALVAERFGWEAVTASFIRLLADGEARSQPRLSRAAC